MDKPLEELFDLVIVVIVVLLSVRSIFTIGEMLKEPIVVLMSDKTFVEMEYMPEDYDKKETGADLLLMLTNVDAMSPYPRAIRINSTPVIKIDSSYVAAKVTNLSAIYNATGPYKLSTMLDYEVTDSYYVYDQPNSPYIQYILEEVP